VRRRAGLGQATGVGPRTQAGAHTGGAPEPSVSDRGRLWAAGGIGKGPRAWV